MTIVIVQSKVTGHWGYCPKDAVALLRPELDDKPTGYRTAEAALAAAKADRSIPRHVVFEVEEVTP